MEQGLTIQDNRIAWTDGASEAAEAPLAQYAEALVRLAERGESEEPIPPGVRFLIHREPASLVVLEEPPQVRTVQWIDDGSVEPFGEQADYRRVRLAFPYIVIVAVFMGGVLTTRTQCFYRTAPLTGKHDRLFFPNLYNVNYYENMPCWLCLQKLDGIAPAHSWREKVEAIRRHFWGAAFNRSASLNPETSYWWCMKKLDPRISSLQEWEAATQRQPLFPLQIPWMALDQTLGESMERMMNKFVAPRRFAVTKDWTVLLQSLEPGSAETRQAEPAP